MLKKFIFSILLPSALLLGSSAMAVTKSGYYQLDGTGFFSRTIALGTSTNRSCSLNGAIFPLAEPPWTFNTHEGCNIWESGGTWYMQSTHEASCTATCVE